MGSPPRARCVFCDIVAGIAPATIVHRWPDTNDRFDAVAIAPLNPVTVGHLLVIPARHVPDFTADPEVAATVMRYAAEIAEPPANVITSAGRDATQTVEHLHLHIVPRRYGDGLTLPWTGQTSNPPAARRPDLPAYVNFDHMTWPHPDDPMEIEWSLRYGDPPRQQRHVAASYIAAYRWLIGAPIALRNRRIAGIRRAARALAERLKTGS